MIILCDCSKAALRESGRISAMDQLCGELIAAVEKKHPDSKVVIIGYDTESPDSDVPLFVEREYTGKNMGDVLPSSFDLYKGNSPLGRGIMHASELMEACRADSNTLIMMVSCIGNGDVPSDFAYKVSCQNNESFQRSQKAIFGMNTKDSTVEQLAALASAEGPGRVHAYRSSDYLDYGTIIG